MVYRWQELSEQHSKLLGENISLASQADNLLAANGDISPESAKVFLALAEKSEIADRDTLEALALSEKQFAYREALKEYEPGNVSIMCPHCKSSPWEFQPGSCQLCGNTPRTKK